MRHVKRYWELLRTREYRREKHLSIMDIFAYAFVTILLGLMIFTQIGRSILMILAVISCIAIDGICVVFTITRVAAIVKDFQNMKKKWKIDEVMHKEEAMNDASEEQEEAMPQVVSCSEEQGEVTPQVVSCSEEQGEVTPKESSCSAPYYFFDLSALIHYSGRFYAGFLTECFDYSWITDEANAIFVTDEQIIKSLQKMEKDSQNNEIYLGYTAYIMRHFQILPYMDSTLFAEYFALAQKVSNITFVTRDERYAGLMEGEGANVKVVL